MAGQGKVNAGNDPYSAAHFALEIDNGKPAFFRSLEGGGIKTEIVDARVGAQHGIWRQLGPVKYEDVRIQVGMSMSETFYAWIESFFSGKVDRRNAEIVAADFHYQERARRVLSNVLISEVAIPALDGADSKACYMTVTLVPEWIRFKPLEGGPKSLGTEVPQNQKLWTPSNFAFVLHERRFADACKRVTKVDGFSIKQEILEHKIGCQPDPIRVPGLIEFPNVAFYLPESDAQPFIDHFSNVVVESKQTQGDARGTGHISFNDHQSKALCTIHLDGIDIASVAPEKADVSSEDIKLVKVEITCESMSFKYGPATTEAEGAGVEGRNVA